MKNIAICLTFMMLCFQASAIEIVTQKQYPPYPDIWGVDLTHYPCFRDNQGYLTNKAMPNGDRWFGFPQGSNNSYTQSSIYQFFAERTIDISEEESYEILGSSDQNPPEKCDFGDGCIDRVKLNNGDTLEYPKECWKYCPFVYECSRLVRRNAKGDAVRAYTVLMVRQKEKKFLDEGMFCESSLVTSKALVREQLLHINDELAELKDGTFLVCSNSGLVVRFDENLKTKFRTGPVKLSDGRVLKSKFFVLDYSVVEKMIWEVRMDRSKPTIQAAHDRIADYLYENQDTLIKQMSK